MDENGKHKRYLKLWEKHGWKADLTPDCLEEEDRAPFGGGLRCFKKVFIRDDYGNTIEHVPKVRCKNPVIKKSLFCKKHGGGNSNALVNGKRSLTKNLYRGAFQSDLSDLFDKFLNDPAILDIRPELAALRTCFVKWVTELEKPKSERDRDPG